MGLDITAKSNMALVGLHDEYNEAWEGYEVEVSYINPDFPHAVPASFAGKQYALYFETAQTQAYSFRAGSYGGYSQFRRTLGMGTAVEDIWRFPERFVDAPFFEMINFSDCEGLMTGPVCAKLHKDFVDNLERYTDYVVETVEDDFNYYISKYLDWTEAFRLGSMDGYVAFH